MNVIAAAGHFMDGTGRCIYLGSDASDQWDTNELGAAIINSVKRWRATGARVVCMTDEAEISGKPGIWEAWLENIFRTAKVQMPTIKILNRGNKQKDDRIREAAAMWLDRRMLLLEGAPFLEDLIEQMTKIGMTEHDDFADAMADCFHREVYTAVYLTGSQIRDERTNPFDDVLKPGGIGIEAMEKIAKRYDEQKAMYEGYWDVVKP